MKNSPHKRSHERKKIVRQSQSLPFAEDKEPYNLENLQKDYHHPDLDKKRLKKEEHLSSELHSFEKRMERKKAKRGKKRSKRQQPGIEIDYMTEPESIHPEGKRWNDVVNLQSRDRGARIKNKLDHTKHK